MNPFVFACMTPHGSEIIAELSPHNPALMAKTRASMDQLGQWMQAANPEVIVVLTPHGVRVDGMFAVADCERMYGEVEDHGATVTMERRVHRPLASALVGAARGKGIPVAAVNYATSAGPLSCLPLDWGVIVPLYFMPEVPVVVINPPRPVDLNPHYEFGRVLAEVVQSSGLRAGLIASCDWAHAHREDGLYGYHPAASELDARVVEIVREGRLEKLAEFSEDFVENAKPDGIWQASVLAGAIPAADRHSELLSYEVPTYFGLLCAAFHNR